MAGYKDPVQDCVSVPDSQPTQTQSQSQSQPVVSLTPLSEERQHRWAILEPEEKIRSKGFQLLNMVNDSYTAGKTRHSDIIFNAENIEDRAVKPTVPISCISKIHFTIKKEKCTSRGDFVVILIDHSRNGTFVNTRMVGKDNKVVLENNDVIAVGKANFSDSGPGFSAVFKITVFGYSNNSLPPTLKKQYTMLRRLGSGAAGIVHLAYSKGKFNAVAIKAINKAKTAIYGPRNPLHDPKKIQNEVNILRQLEHPCIIKLENIIDTPERVYIVLELMEGGELFDRITASRGLPEKVSKFIFWQICHAVHYLHSNGITHRDLKPENILLASNDEYPLVKVSDFGMSKLVDAESMMKTYCGTPLYVAPEILKTRGRGVYTTQVDVWSLGVILYLLLSGWVPFNSHDERTPLSEQIIKGLYRFPNRVFRQISNDAKILIRATLNIDYTRRLTISQVLKHPWLIKDTEIMNAVTLIMGGTPANENMPPNRGCISIIPEFQPKRARLG